MAELDLRGGPFTLECREGQHHACRGDVWTISADYPYGCVCTCHEEKKS
jgi:hypothetical protein